MIERFTVRIRRYRARRLLFALSISVASLGLTIVLTEIGLRAGKMNPDIAVALVGAALLSLLLFPTIAGSLLSRAAAPMPDEV